jgi:hypothetical protein
MEEVRLRDTAVAVVQPLVALVDPAKETQRQTWLLGARSIEREYRH